MNRDALADLMAEYGMALDEDRLEDWVELFEEACDYRIVTRENVVQGLPNVLIWCDNKNMLRDRIESYRNVNLYNPHYDRHVIGMPRIVSEKGGVVTYDASYSLFQTTLEGESRLFSVGRYRVEARLGKDRATLKSVMVIADTGQIPSLLATPI
jgi:anthranilate 1,2-dioxygenase small subunit